MKNVILIKSCGQGYYRRIDNSFFPYCQSKQFVTHDDLKRLVSDKGYRFSEVLNFRELSLINDWQDFYFKEGIYA